MDALQEYHLAACDAIIQTVERAEQFYRDNDPIHAALELSVAVDRIRAHLNGDDV